MLIAAQLDFFSRDGEFVLGRRAMLRELAEAGYDAVEDGPDALLGNPAHIHGLPLSVCALTVKPSQLDDLDALAHYCTAMGCKAVACLGLSDDDTASADNRQSAIPMIEKAGQELHGHNIRLLYGNRGSDHSAADNGPPVFDLAMRDLDPRFVGLRFDAGLVWRADADATDLMRQYASRVESVVLRDYSGDMTTELGKGRTPVRDIVAAARSLPACEFLIVAQDPSGHRHIERMAESRGFLKRECGV